MSIYVLVYMVLGMFIAIACKVIDDENEMKDDWAFTLLFGAIVGIPVFIYAFIRSVLGR